jgi:MFS family permease
MGHRAVLLIPLGHAERIPLDHDLEETTCKSEVDAVTVDDMTSELQGTPAATTDRRTWLALALLCVVQFMVVLDIAIVNVALPSIKDDLGFSQGDLQWVISAYALVFGGFLLLGGRAADMLGRRRIFLGGIAVFTVASLLAGLAWSEPSLIGARAFQGLGAAIITPAALSILSTTFAEGRERNIALGAWGAVGGFGAVAGVLLGGVLTDADFAAEFRTRFLQPKVEVSRRIYARAQARGEIAPGVDLDLIAPALTGILLHRVFLLGQAVDDRTVEAVIDQIILPAATGRQALATKDSP